MHRDAALPQKGPGSGGAVEERYVCRCLICFRFSKPSMNSAKTQHTIKMIAIDVTVQFMSLSSIVMPPDDHSIIVRLARRSTRLPTSRPPSEIKIRL
jgi:hypothetical protein